MTPTSLSTPRIIPKTTDVVLPPAPPLKVPNGQAAPSLGNTFFERMLRSSNVGSMGFNDAGQLVFFNEKAVAWVRRYFEVELQYGLSVSEIFISGHNYDFSDCLEQALAGEAQQFHCCFVVGNIEERRFQIQFLPMSDGDPNGALVEIVQVASRIVLNKSIIEQDELSRYLVQNSSDVMALLESNGSIRYLSPSAESMLGFPVDMFIGRNARKYIHPDDLQKLLELGTSTAFKPGTQVAVSFRLLHANGSWIHLEAVATNLLQHPGIQGFVINARDVTERKKAEEVLAREKEWLAVTLRSIGDAVITTDLDGKVALINPTAEELTGYSAKQAQAKALSQIYHVIDPDSGKRLELPLEDLVQNAGQGDSDQPPLEQECQLVAKDGFKRLIEHSATPIRDLDGKAVGMVVVFRDITDKHKIAEEIERASRLESVGMLAGGIAHDFNNILLAIINNVSIARAKLDPDHEANERLAEAEKASLKARDLTRQLLTFSKGGAPVLNTYLLPGIIKESTEFVLHGSNLEVEFDMADDLDPVEIDVGQISQVINNLVINAMQAMPNGGKIYVKASNEALVENNPYRLVPGDYVHISMSDTGPGIPLHLQPKLFDPFFTTKPQGSGLGLATSYSILRNHDGAITVESEVGAGATFHILLPASNKKLSEEDTNEPMLLRGHGRIVLMDDEEDIRDTLPLLLERFGYELDTYPDGKSLIEAYRQARDEGKPYRAALMDLTIPGGMGGREAVKKLKELDPDAKAIVSSGYSSDSTLAEYKKFGFDGMVCKPFKIEELVREIQKVLIADD